MYSRLNKSTLEVLGSGFLYFLYSLFSIVSMGLITKHYSLNVLGMLAILKAFLPGGVMGILDPGMADTVSTYVAKSGGQRDFLRYAKAVVAKLTFFSLVLAVLLLAVVVALKVFFIARFVNGGVGAISVMNDWLTFLSLAFFVVLPGMILEGVLRGCEDFVFLRLLDLLSAFSFFLSVCFAVYFSSTYLLLGYVVIASALLKSLIMLVAILSNPDKSRFLSFVSLTDVTDGKLLSRSYVNFRSKFFITAQSNLPAVLCAGLAGSAAFGLYDLLSKIPRFLKSSIAFVNLMLISYGAKDNLKVFDNALLILVAPQVFSVSIVFIFSIFGPLVIMYWVGETYLQYFVSFSLLLLSSLSAVVVSPILSYLSFDLTVLKETSFCDMWGFFFQLIVFFALYYLVGINALYYSIALAAVVFCLAKFWVACRYLELSTFPYVASYLLYSILMMGYGVAFPFLKSSGFSLVQISLLYFFCYWVALFCSFLLLRRDLPENPYRLVFKKIIQAAH